MHKIKVSGVLYDNIGTIVPEIEYEYWYDVTTRSGKKEQKVKYTKTNYTVTFFNALDGKYTTLRNHIKERNGVPSTCGFPNDTGRLDGFDYAEYIMTIQSEVNKGYLHNGTYYKNAMVVRFERRYADNA